ncbi:EZ1 [Scenedesmus sp. PABB004]|nr:EZ1 [Scenedesmus sp. PABB004]
MELDAPSGMDSDSDAEQPSAPPRRGSASGPSAAALAAVAGGPPARRRRSCGAAPSAGADPDGSSGGGSGGRDGSGSSGGSDGSGSSGSSGGGDSSTESEEEGPPVTRAEVEGVMARYRALRAAVAAEQRALAPGLVAANQAALQERGAELVARRRVNRLAAAEPPPDAERGGGGGGGGDGGGDGGGGEGAAGGERPPPFTARYTSKDATGYGRRAFRLAFEQRFLPRSELAAEHGLSGQCMFYTDETGETMPASDDEDNDQARRAGAGSGRPRERLRRRLARLAGGSRAAPAAHAPPLPLLRRRAQKPWNAKEGWTHDHALVCLAEEHADRLPWLLAALSEGLRTPRLVGPKRDDAGLRVSPAGLAARLEFLKGRAPPPAPPTEQQRMAASFRHRRSALRRHFCVRCNVYHCRLHGGDHVLPANRPPPPRRRPLRGRAGRAAGGTRPPRRPARRSPARRSPARRSPRWVALLLLERSCAEVRSWLQLLPADAPAARSSGGGSSSGGDGAPQEDATPEPPLKTAAAQAARRRKRGGGAWRQQSARRLVASKRATDSKADRAAEPYAPCTCAGPCKPGSCSCIASSNYCERFCACVGCADRDCFFEGCRCVGDCRTNDCACLKAGRECDPAVCARCKPAAAAAAAGGAGAAASAEGAEPCGNMGMRLRQHPVIHVGLSGVAGWGAFLGQSVRTGDFLGEYVGELLTQAEANRRGKAYDRSNNSYLFGVNSEWVLDARGAGNKLRFANHSSAPNCGPRCVCARALAAALRRAGRPAARAASAADAPPPALRRRRGSVLMVDGDHRVGLYALRAIAAGEELFYNYRYDLDNAPAWAIRE